jgi:hypothetical protein
MSSGSQSSLSSTGPTQQPRIRLHGELFDVSFRGAARVHEEALTVTALVLGEAQTRETRAVSVRRESDKERFPYGLHVGAIEES